jgi:hypothetical protein
MQILLAITSTGERFFQFLKGVNNEVSVSAFFVLLARDLVKLHPDWRKTHVLLLENCSSHKTELARDTNAKLGF